MPGKQRFALQPESVTKFGHGALENLRISEPNKLTEHASLEHVGKISDEQTNTIQITVRNLSLTVTNRHCSNQCQEQGNFPELLKNFKTK